MIYTREEKEVRSVAADALDSVDIAAFSRYLYQRRKLVISASLVALVLTGLGSFLTPRKYTATASILIEPPAGNDPRGAMAVSPVYLESLKTYEHFASSDTLFRQALTHLHLREAYSGVPIENLKSRMLKVTKPKDQKILEISATLPDGTKAQQFAQYIAEQTVSMNRSLESDSTRDLTSDATKLVDAGWNRLKNAREARDAFLARQPVAILEAQLANTTDLKSRIDRNLTDAEVEMAAILARVNSQHSDKSVPARESVTQDDLAAIRAEVSALRQQSQNLAETVSTYSGLLEKRKQAREILDKEVLAAQAQYEAAITRKTDVVSSAAFRGERLEIIDPGVVPERASSPNVSLNLTVALLGSIFCCVLYLAVRFGYLRMQSAGR